MRRMDDVGYGDREPGQRAHNDTASFPRQTVGERQ